MAVSLSLSALHSTGGMINNVDGQTQCKKIDIR